MHAVVLIPDSFVVADLVGWWNITDSDVLPPANFTHRREILVVGRCAADCLQPRCSRDAYSRPSRNASVSLSVRF